MDEIYKSFRELTKKINSAEITMFELRDEFYKLSSNYKDIELTRRFQRITEAYFNWLYYEADASLFDIERTHEVSDFLLSECVPNSLTKAYRRLPKWFS